MHISEKNCTFAAFLGILLTFMKKVLLFSLLLTAWVGARAEVTHLTVEKLDGTEASSALAVIGKLIMGYDDVCLYDHEGNELGCTPYTQLEKIMFYQESATGLEDEHLTLRGIEGGQTIRVYSMQGQLVLTTVAADGEASLYLGGLPSGTYLVQAGGSVTKVTLIGKR